MACLFHVRRSGEPAALVDGKAGPLDVVVADPVVEIRAFEGKLPLTAKVTEAALLHLIDALSVGLAAAGSPAGAPYRGLATDLAHGGAATVFGFSSGASAADPRARRRGIAGGDRHRRIFRRAARSPGDGARCDCALKQGARATSLLRCAGRSACAHARRPAARSTPRVPVHCAAPACSRTCSERFIAR